MKHADARSSISTDSTQNTGSTKLRELCEDVQYFNRDFSYIADQAPLQLYASALTFAPESSQVKSLFKDCMPQWLVIPPRVADVWDANSLVLEGHTGLIAGVSISSCGKYLGTFTVFEPLNVWDTATDNCTLRIPRSEHETPVDISFSHDSKCLAAAYYGHNYSRKDLPLSAVIYDMQTGNVIETYVCTEIDASRYRSIRIAFAPGPSKALLVAILNVGRLEVWRTKLGSHMFEQAWGVRTPTNKRKHFTISASDSPVSCFSRHDRSITSWRLETGAYVSSHKIELDIDRFGGFINCQGEDPIYLVHRRARSTDDGQWFGRPSVQKLDPQTGQVDLITYVEVEWQPQAVSLTIGAIAYTKHHTGVVSMIDLLQCPKTDKLTSYVVSPVVHTFVSRNGEKILVAYADHVELRDVLGSIVFRSIKVNLSAYETHTQIASVSGDGCVVTARLDHGTRVWFVKSGRELQLPITRYWRCQPVVTGDGKLMHFVWKLCARVVVKNGRMFFQTGFSCGIWKTTNKSRSSTEATPFHGCYSRRTTRPSTPTRGTSI